MLEDLVVGVEGWLAGRSALAEARAMILAEIAARSTAGLDHLNALLTSGALPASFRNRDVLAACKVVQARLPDEGQGSGVRDQASGAPGRTGAGMQVERLTPDTCRPDPLSRPRLGDGPSRRPGLRDHHPRGRAAARCAPAPGSVHLIVTSPPYNVGVGYRSHDDALADDEVHHPAAGVVRRVRAVLVDGGRIAVVVPAGVGRNPWRPLASRVAGAARRRRA